MFFLPSLKAIKVNLFQIFLIFFSCYTIQPAYANLEQLTQILSEKQGQKAFQHIQKIPQNERLLGLWLLTTTRLEDISAQDLAHINQNLPNWPSQERRQRRIEEQLWREQPSPQKIAQILTWSPLSIEGTVLAIQMYLAQENKAAAEMLAQKIWHEKTLSVGQEKFLLQHAATLLSQKDHFIRANYMLYKDRVTAAKRLLPYLNKDQGKLVKARSAVSKKQKNALKLLKSLPRKQRKTIHAQFSHAQALRRSNQILEAESIMRRISLKKEPIHADEWWVERRVLARELLEINQPKKAYAIVTNRHQTSSRYQVEAEFHAGWIALQFLNKPQKALSHFKAIKQSATIPASKARAHYWIGRALKAMGKDPRAHYEMATTYYETFYGQMAYVKLFNNRPIKPAPLPKVNGQRRSHIKNDPRFQAIKLLHELNKKTEKTRFYTHLAKTMPQKEALIILAKEAKKLNDHRNELLIGKEAVKRFRGLERLAFPTSAIKRGTNWPKKVETAAVFAIAKQESEFNPKAQSPAKAYGLMQFLKPTARQTANRANIPYNAKLLTQNASYNATLGAHFIDELLQRFEGTYPKVFAAYNAGPSRVPQWKQRFGNPNKSLEKTIDWIELIPFTETRHYVQKCMENLIIYREILK